ncbi:orotidine 5'-phosphate decarboxylase [Nitrosococcus oceani AFC27]|uniref:Orotidine 5'-phosphate decarboxylase n=2 Tax=Nitrosococcus oceani TaxID=1229 RepID=PYRF_NITOC|nr:orotidine-5'-phosphate decarboxylase [Nitrosococcus oceani]Q3J8N5.2 RecName: Full=Orotidine 5'-phosphate decarboxylase; AltName: Full=OMP decarboxylase; Short=OMPDCase; Short=OMPdecase [Nitrosococcus oceani ATCC 19707]EDZ68122.1 orotidine 5'-phosphate decarboxylase [Nitrosococcus oceani AFC27]KFI18619.1 orotidine 5'-phosphate decarboxylase [Nitrosococcus oceani C-27]GEM19099.1 orotidine-5'-phosphate decarboxylase [Nitrosococcus oceani]
MEKSRIIIALDYPNEEQALSLVRQLDPAQCRLKVGKELFTRAGPSLVKRLAAQGFPIFLDLKFHDIPHTVARACLAAADLGVWMLNIHALGGLSMMKAAQEALANHPSHPQLIAVTVLTSMDQAALSQIGLAGTPEDNVLQLALLTQEAGLDGIVCSGQEAPALRQTLGKEFLLVTPGIRPAGAAPKDQQRVLTPREALAKGANYLVIGRPITAAPDPMMALRAIEAEISNV